MANTDRPNGFVPIKHLNGNPYNGEGSIYYIPSTDSTATFKNDLVSIAGSADATGKYPTVKQTTAGDTNIVGSIQAFSNTPYFNADATNLSRTYRLASTAIYVFVADDPDLIYEVQEDSVGSTLAATNVGQNADVIVGSGGTTTGLSAMELDSSTAATTAANCRILRLVSREGNDIGSNARWEVMLNEHYLKKTVGS